MTIVAYNNLMMIIALVISLLVAFELFILVKKDVKGKVVEVYLDKREQHRNGTKISVEKQTAYKSADEKLSRMGIKYRFKRDTGKVITPFDYVMIRVLVTAAFALVGAIFGIVGVIGGVIFGVVIVPYYYSYENENDNKEMLNDICTMYSTAALEKKNGVPDAIMLYDCFLGCENHRLKQALLELSMDLERTRSILTATENFSAKFTNRYIDDFCRVLQQADETGASVQLFEDMQRSIDGINEAINIREEHKQEQIGFAWQTATFISVIIFILYIVSLMFGDASTLLG